MQDRSDAGHLGCRTGGMWTGMMQDRSDEGQERWQRGGMHERWHSWAQRKLSPLNPLNILFSINSPLHSLGFNGLND